MNTGISTKPVDAATAAPSRVVTTIRDDTDGKFHFVHKQELDEIMLAMHRIPDMTSRYKLMKSEFRLFGTVPNLFATKWAKETGTKLFSKEWLEVVKKKLEGEYQAFKIKY